MRQTVRGPQVKAGEGLLQKPERKTNEARCGTEQLSTRNITMTWQEMKESLRKKKKKETLNTSTCVSLSTYFLWLTAVAVTAGAVYMRSALEKWAKPRICVWAQREDEEERPGSSLNKSNYVSLLLQPGLSIPDNLLWQSTTWPACFQLPVRL